LRQALLLTRSRVLPAIAASSIGALASVEWDEHLDNKEPV
jgi:hypothetical protein